MDSCYCTFFSEMARGILKISNVSQRKGFGIHPKNIFVARRISGIPGKTGQIVNCRFLGHCICYVYDFFTIRLQIFCEFFLRSNFVIWPQKGQIWKMTRMGSYYMSYGSKFYGDSENMKIIFFWCNMTPLSTKLVFKAFRSVFTGLYIYD
jgi:hypothetical protein